MSDVPILVCDCGMKLRAPGAKPGRVGRCPRCGGTLRVPDAPPANEPAPVRSFKSAEPEPGPEPAHPDEAPPVAAPPRRRKKKKGRPNSASGHETEIWDGLLAAPRQPEMRIRDSLPYPLWGATGVAALVILPPLLWVTSVPVIGGVVAVFGGDGSPPALMGLLMLLPTAIGLFAVLGYTLLFLGRVLASSALGEVHHPRWPDWELTSMAHGLGRWLWAGLVGGVVGGVPAVAYWVRCGDVDLFDAVILAELSAVGAVYALMALLASVLHEDILAANPFTVLSAVFTLGWGYAVPCLVAGGAVALVVPLALAALEAGSPPVAAFLAYAFWFLFVYASMVVLRVLGLFYSQNARRLGWFRGRTGWGV